MANLDGAADAERRRHLRVQLLPYCRVIHYRTWEIRHEYKSGSHDRCDGRLADSGSLRDICDCFLHLCNDHYFGFSSGLKELDMRKLLWVATLSLAALPVIANAHGCIKGAAVGGVVGHVAGHHAVAGAAIGCVVGHHRAKEKQKEKEQEKEQQAAQQPAAMQT
jgi:hypothetical protein